MAFSLGSLFKRKRATPVEEVVPVVPNKSSADRLSKTVLPSHGRSAISSEAFKSTPTAMPSAPPPAPAPPPPITMTIAGPPMSNHLPPAVAFALRPQVERVVPFALSDAVGEMPAGFVRPLAGDEPNRMILLKAAELERGMGTGRPTISVGTIYQQVPEIFVKPIDPGDATPVPLPVTQVLEQITKLQQREDQDCEQEVPQVETPFLKVTLEDNDRFGIPTPPLQTNPMPPVKVLPATAQAIAAAEPEPTEQYVPRLKPAPIAKAPAEKIAPPVEKPAAAPTRIPFKLTPNGAGVSAAEGVPASSGGTSVPTSLTSTPPPPPKPNGPTRIPFKLVSPPVAEPQEEAKPPGEPWLTKENIDAPPVASTDFVPLLKKDKSGPTISLPLKPILQALPPFQLTGDVKTVSDDARIELPFAAIEPQLASGRVSLPAEEFESALPEECRKIFSTKEIATPVSLPLQDVLKNIPATALQMRADQEEQDRGGNYATPFSTTADEDAKRFNIPSAAIEKPAVSLTSAPAPVVEAKPEMKPAVKLVAAPQPTKSEEAKPVVVAPVIPPRASTPAPKIPQPVKRSALQQELDTDETLEPKTIVALIGKIAGVQACAIVLADGLTLAGNLPDTFEVDGLSAMAPSLLQRVETSLTETKLGTLAAMTLTCTTVSITLFMHDKLCLLVLHASGDLPPPSRERLNRITRQLSSTYSQPA